MCVLNNFKKKATLFFRPTCRRFQYGWVATPMSLDLNWVIIETMKSIYKNKTYAGWKNVYIYMG